MERYKLCTAEKPSVASDIARVIGANKKENGYYIGNGYIVTWAVGHLVGLEEPEAYGYVKQSDMYSDEAAKSKAYDELPLFPRQFKLTVLEKTREQFEIVKKLMHREDVEYIIDCGDMGAEGHILQWLIREKAGCTKPVKRFCAVSLTDQAIKEAMANLRNAEEFMPIIRGEFCKKKEDWILGMSLSRALSIKYNTGINVGRVQSPTLGFVVQRYLEVANFQVSNYFVMDAEIQGDPAYHVFWDKDREERFSKEAKMPDGRILQEALLQREREKILADPYGIVKEVAKTKKGTDRPQLYDITELQREANRKFGYTAAETLAAAQALYETQKVLSYPRTDSRYITEDLVSHVTDRIKDFCRIEKYRAVAERVIADQINFDKRIIDNSKVTDHHALIVTEKIATIDLSAIKPTKDEAAKGVTADMMQNILDLIIVRMLVSLSHVYKYEQTSVTVEMANGMKFTATGKKPVQMGWRAIQEQLSGKEEKESVEEAEQPEQLFPALQQGQKVRVQHCEILSKKTTPPKYHTEATLLTAMEHAGQHIENGEILKGKGIGTQATRAEIIKKLFDTGVVETLKKGKTPYIVPTKKGMSIIQILPPDLYSPKITADWEIRIANLVAGKDNEIAIMQDFEKYIRAKTEQIKGMEAKVNFSKEREVYGMCPWCGSPVYRFQNKDERGKVASTRYYCSSESCSWDLRSNDMIFMTRLSRQLSEAEAKRFIAKKSIVLTCTSQKSGEKYKREFSFIKRVSNGKTYCNIKCDPVQGTKSKSKN